MDTPIPPPATPNLSDDESQKKYIRTFAGDMDIVKKGGTPDLRPLEETPPTPPTGTQETIPFTPSPAGPELAAPVAEEIPVPPPPAPPPPPSPPPPPPPPVEPPSPAPEPEPIISIEPPAPPPIKPPPPIQFPEPTPVRAPEINASPLETYRGDFLQKVKDTNASTVTVLAAEQDSATAEPEPSAKKASSGVGIVSVIAGIVLVLLGGIGAYFGYMRYVVKSAPVLLTPTVTAPIFFDEKEEISGNTPATLQQAISDSLNKALAPNAVRLLYTTTATSTGSDIFSKLQFPVPGILLRNIVSAQSMAGIINSDGTASPFFILSVASYQDTFAGMLSWEPTMPNDLGTLFLPQTMPVSTTTATTTIQTATTTLKTTVKTVVKAATSTPAVPATTLVFHDQVVDNHDVRIYQDAQGHSVLVYGYWNKTTLVIAHDPDAFTEILGRLATKNTQ